MKKETIKQRYIDKKPIGYYTLSNTSELLFYIPHSDEWNNDYDIIVGLVIGEITNYKNQFRGYKFHYNRKDEPFIIWKGNRIYLSEVERVII